MFVGACIGSVAGELAPLATEKASAWLRRLLLGLVRRVLLRLEAELVMAMKRRGQGLESNHEVIRPGGAVKPPFSAY
jgi:hypothetical protein